jgi:hypothetical protein
MAEELSGSDACDKAPGLEGTEDVVKACDKGKTWALATNVLIGTTVVGAVATVLFYYKGYVEPRSANEGGSASVRPRKKSSPVVSVTPAVSPTTLGAGVRIDF